MERDFVQRSMQALGMRASPGSHRYPDSLKTTGPCPPTVWCAPVNATGITNDEHGRIVAEKQLLPTYDVFDEARYFETAPVSPVRSGD